ncbi:MAG: 50S ribosomal protein L3 [Bdellovibrionales bacterium RIFOXYD1_FULL_53_11]|nr:MAG: 50S ribosomal protein L3 [Bdellovibrionales bacterium RIFOXYD1_FULL_53_11]
MEQKTERERTVLAEGRGGILGVKAGMTQVFDENGDVQAVTVIDLVPNVITQVKTKVKEGYAAVQVGVLEKKAKKAKKAEQGHVKKSGATGFYRFHEFRMDDAAKLDGLTVGKVLSADFLKPGDYVDLTSRSKGKGYQGGVKRYHMAGGFKTHGCSVSHRSLGSIGNRADPGKCFKNKKMPGQMGNVQITVQNVRVVRVDMENGVLLVNGSVPGPRSSIVTIRRTVKNAG